MIRSSAGNGICSVGSSVVSSGGDVYGEDVKHSRVVKGFNNGTGDCGDNVGMGGVVSTYDGEVAGHGQEVFTEGKQLGAGVGYGSLRGKKEICIPAMHEGQGDGDQGGVLAKFKYIYTFIIFI